MTKACITKEMTVNDTIRDFPKTVSIFAKFKIDSCCGGAASIEAAAARDGAPLDELIKALNEATDTTLA